MQDQSDDLPCQARVGFLFKRTCGRMSRVGCPYCKGQPLPRRTDTWGSGYDPYFTDRSMYRGYGNYSRGYWGNDYYMNDFRDSDRRSFHHESDTNYEQDLDAS